MNIFKRLFGNKKKYSAGNIENRKKYSSYPAPKSVNDPATGESYSQPYIADDYAPVNDVGDHSTHFDGGSFGDGGASDSWSDDSSSSGSYDSGSSDSGSSDSGSSGSD